MKGLNMNEITLNKTEQLLKDGYKLIYPNNFGLNLSMKSNERITNNNIIYKIGIAFDGFRIIEGFRNRNKLFLSDRIYHEIYKLENDNYRNRNPLVLFFEEKNGTYIKVTDGYSPLEMYSLKAENDERTDIYSLSALLYFMITKKKPDEVLKRFYNTELIFDEDISEDIRKFIEKGMEVEIKDRFNNVVEMKSEFEKLDFKDI